METITTTQEQQKPTSIWQETSWLPQLWDRTDILLIVGLFIFFYIVGQFAPFLFFSIDEIVSPSPENTFTIVLLSLTSTTIASLVSVFLINALRPRHGWIKLGFQAISSRWFWIATAIGVGAAFIRMVLLSGAILVFPALAESAEALSSLFNFEDPSQLLIVGIIASTLVPFYEEIFFRGFIHNALRNRFGMWVAIGISSLIFGLIHFFPIQIISAALLAIALGWLYERSTSLWAVIYAHAVNNFIAFGLSYVALLLDIPL